MHDRGHLLTEQIDPAYGDFAELSLEAAFDRMNAADASIAAAVAAAKNEIVAAVRCVSQALRRGGRLFYVGAGTSGRLGVLDAAECPPTFLSDPAMIQGIIAGGSAALERAVENAEDAADAGAVELERRGLNADDVVLGIAAGGTTPFVHGALRWARGRGAATIFLACVPQTEAPDEADISIRVLTGPEVLAGSTRLKAGLATKMTLNAISTLTMVRLGKVYGNLMVDVNAFGCAKLRDRAIRITMRATGVERTAAEALLDRARGHVKTAILMQRSGLERDAATRLLGECDGHLRCALLKLAAG